VVALVGAKLQEVGRHAAAAELHESVDDAHGVCVCVHVSEDEDEEE
jgi:hypothetical protein